MTPPSSHRTLEHAERIAALLRTLGVDVALIGAVAMATYSYTRATDDIDLATSVDVWTKLRDATTALNAAGYDAQLETPDAEDPLGGVVTIRPQDSDPIQIVNFLNPFTGGAGELARDAIARAVAAGGAKLPVVPLPHLIAFKLYSGGVEAVADVVQLLGANPTADRAEIRATCDRLGLGELFERIARAAAR